MAKTGLQSPFKRNGSEVGHRPRSSGHGGEPDADRGFQGLDRQCESAPVTKKSPLGPLLHDP